jgi:phospholipid-binding lipoprotein MlaA
MKRGLTALAAAAALAGCATTGNGTPDPRDPFEPVNRAVFEFNQVADRTVFRPVAEVYAIVIPQPIRTGVTSFFGNLNDAWTAANNLLQGKLGDSINDFGRVFVNSTFGLGGILDWATPMGMEKHNEDFGQTLGVWGVPSGPYVVIPIFGPSSVRDTAGFVVDIYAYPLFWILRWADPVHRVSWRNIATGVGFVNARANNLAATDLLEQAALDRYSYVRSAFFQRRLNQIFDGAPFVAPASSRDSFRRTLAADDQWDAPGLPGTVFAGLPVVDALPLAAGTGTPDASPAEAHPQPAIAQ